MYVTEKGFTKHFKTFSLCDSDILIYALDEVELDVNQTEMGHV